MTKKHIVIIISWITSIILSIVMALLESISLGIFIFGISTLMLFYISVTIYLLRYLYKRFGKKIISKNFTYLAKLLSNKEREERKCFIKSYADPIFSTLIWLAPVVGMIAFVVSGVVYLLKDEEDRDRKKFSKQAKVILVVTVVIMSASIIFNIVGIATS